MISAAMIFYSLHNPATSLSYINYHDKMVLYNLHNILNHVDVQNLCFSFIEKHGLSFLPVKVISNFVCSDRSLLTYLFIDFNRLEPLSR